MDQPLERSPERVLVLTPAGRDAEMVEQRLASAGLPCEVCEDMDGLLSALRTDAGVALVAQEALAAKAEALLAALEAQEPWSDIPILLLTPAPSKGDRYAPATARLLERANVMLLQRPVPMHVLFSAVHSALRARRRQHQMRDLYQDLSRAVHLSDMFVSILGHDLRTPLSAIKMGAQLIDKTTEDTRAVRTARRILNSTERMTRMIEQLLDFAQLRGGQGLRLQLTRCNLGDIARQVLQELGDANPQANIDASTSGTLDGLWDPDRLAQIVSNLVGNAVQHGTPERPITVELSGTRPDLVHLRVANAGEIHAEAIPKLFDPFKHASTPKADRRGLGLGLFIAREIVRAHGGDLIVRAVEGSTIFEATVRREARAIKRDTLAPA